MPRFFASDNSSGIHPEVLTAIEVANDGHVPAYGDDPFTASAQEAFRRHLGDGIDVFFVFGGTGANVLGLRTVTESYHAILCAASSHIYVDECAAPERHLGCKLIPIPTDDGKLRPVDITPHLKGFGVEHHAQCTGDDASGFPGQRGPGLHTGRVAPGPLDAHVCGHPGPGFS